MPDTLYEWQLGFTYKVNRENVIFETKSMTEFCFLSIERNNAIIGRLYQSLSVIILG